MNRMRCLIGLALLSSVALGGCRSKKDVDDREAVAAKSADDKNKVVAAGPTTEDRVREFYPLMLGDFVRTDVAKYDKEGENVSVGYNLFREGRETEVAFTAYFYPNSKATFDDALKAEIDSVKSEHRNVKVGPTEPAQTRQLGQYIAGSKVTFRYDEKFGAGERQAVVSELYLFPKGDRLVKYRITYPASAAGLAQQKLSALVPAFPWPSSI